MADARPNIIVLMSDHHRADAFGCAGNPVAQTPNLDRLASQGVRFARAYCQGPVCMPARASFLTERYVREHGVDDNNRQVAPDMPTFLHPLREAGYHTANIGKMHLYAYTTDEPDTRIAAHRLQVLGFDESHELPAQMVVPLVASEYSDYLAEHGLLELYKDWVDERTPGGGEATVGGRRVPRKPEWHTEVSPLPAHAYIDAWVGARTERWIEEYTGDAPFFLWTGFPGPHNPWDAPQEYVDRYRDVEIPLGSRSRPSAPADGPGAAFFAKRAENSGSDELTEERIREVARFFYASVTLIDERVGGIIAALERRGVLENTWIFYTTDHGEMLGEHLLLGKGVFYEPSVGVPLIVRPPGGMAGRVEEGIVAHIDAPATIRAIAGAGPVPESHGESLLGHFSAGAGVTHEVTYTENLGFMAAITARYKLVVHVESGIPVQLFDLQEDAAEDHNLVDDPAHAATRARMLRDYVGSYLALERADLPAVPTRVQMVMGRAHRGR